MDPQKAGVSLSESEFLNLGLLFQHHSVGDAPVSLQLPENGEASNAKITMQKIDDDLKINLTMSFTNFRKRLDANQEYYRQLLIALPAETPGENNPNGPKKVSADNG